MRTRRIWVMWIFLCVISSVQAEGFARQVLEMNTDWAFFRGDCQDGQSPELDDSNWIPTVVPHIMQLEKKHCGGNGIYQGIGWYRRYFTLDKAFQGKRVCIAFEGVMTSCNVFINGKEIKKHYGGYVGFEVDVTDHLNWEGNNLLAVRVSAEYDPFTPPGKPQENMDFYYYSGIYRDVAMTITDRIHITDPLEAGVTAGGGVFVTYPEVSKEKSRVHVKTHLKNGGNTETLGELRTSLWDSKGRKVAVQVTPIRLNQGGDMHYEQDITVLNPQLWHPYSPHRYILKSEVLVNGQKVDEVDTKIGIRTIKQTTQGGFFINGQHLYLRGANRHQAYANVGDAVSNSMQEREVIDLKRGGYNAVRAAHYPQDPAFLDACDKHGLLVLECIPGWQYYNPSSIFNERLYEVVQDMVRRDRNHPSIFLWEIMLNESRYPVEIAKTIYDLVHAEYPGDQMYTSGDYFGSAEKADYFDVLYKQVGKFPKDGNVMSNYKEDQLALKPLYSREWGDGVGERPQVSLADDEYQQMRQCRSRLHQLCGNGYFDWCLLDLNERNAGHFVWSYNDYARGCCTNTLFCGVVDINRWPKFSYYMLQSMRDKNISQKGLYNGPMVHIASYNASAEFPSSTKEITVFSNCDAVRLYRNGKWIGEQTRLERTPLYAPIVNRGGSPCFIFDAGDYESGELKAEALVDGKVIATHSVRTAGTPHHLEIEICHKGIVPVADGSDMIPVYIKVCDEKGTLVHESKTTVNLEVSGRGTLIGAGIDRVGIERQQVEGGVGFAFIRASKKQGGITITARSSGLKPAVAKVKTVAFRGRHVPDGAHGTFGGEEEDGVQNRRMDDLSVAVTSKPVLPIANIETSVVSQTDYPVSNLTDGDDRTWWLSSADALPQTITFQLKEPMMVFASRVLFQKDSSSYKHKVETSLDGKIWVELYARECTGWEFKPMPVNKDLKYFRITFLGVSEGRPGMGEVTLFGK